MAYPFLIITNERFPRVLVTRRPELCANGEKVYGAFLPEGMLRRLLDVLGRTFKLRPCEIEIDGSFDAPCPEFYLHRCLAPCVAKLCSEKSYLQSVEDVRLLLDNRLDNLIADLQSEIEQFSAELKFEKASETHEILKIVQDISANSKWRIFADEFTDVITAKSLDKDIYVYQSTLRRGKAVGGRQRIFAKSSEVTNEAQAIEVFLKDAFRFYAPRKIFVSHDFASRRDLEKSFRKSFGANTKIVAETPENLPPTVSASRKYAEIAISNSFAETSRETRKIADELKEIFQTKTAPKVLECYDTAHLGGKSIVTARVVGREGKISTDENFVWQLENLSETDSLAEALRQRFKLLPNKQNLPDAIVLDGGKPQLSAAKKVLKELNLDSTTLIAVVKPPSQHEKISHFLTNTNAEKTEFNSRSAAMNYLQTLRDATHHLSNDTHRRIHSLASIFFENRSDDAPQIRYLLVPQRFAMRGGDAENLSPLRSLNNYGEILLKTKVVTDENGKKYQRRSRWSRATDEK